MKLAHEIRDHPWGLINSKDKGDNNYSLGNFEESA